MDDEGPIRKLVLLPGMDGTAELFAPFIAALPVGFEALPVSYPVDRALSYTELREHVLERLPNSEHFVLLAESFSTPLAVQIAAAKPAGLQALILVTGFVTNPNYEWAARVPTQFLTAIHRVTIPGFAIQKFLLGSDTPRELQFAVRRVVQSVDPKVLGVRLQSILKCDARAELARVRVPILYLQSTQDRVVPPRCLDEILAIRPDVQVTRIDGPHLLLQKEPDEAAMTIATFLTQV